jgi:hypothetical protein
VLRAAWPLPAPVLTLAVLDTCFSPKVILRKMGPKELKHVFLLYQPLSGLCVLEPVWATLGSVCLGACVGQFLFTQAHTTWPDPSQPLITSSLPFLPSFDSVNAEFRKCGFSRPQAQICPHFLIVLSERRFIKYLEPKRVMHVKVIVVTTVTIPTSICWVLTVGGPLTDYK